MTALRPDDLLVGRWGAWFAGRRLPCATGRGGIGEKRAEGDGMTPVGCHRIEAVLYRADRVPPPLPGANAAARIAAAIIPTPIPPAGAAA